jgi:hypothetical protein
MGSNDQEVQPIPAGDPLAAEARREVRAKERAADARADGFMQMVRGIARISGDQAHEMANLHKAMLRDMEKADG